MDCRPCPSSITDNYQSASCRAEGDQSDTIRNFVAVKLVRKLVGREVARGGAERERGREMGGEMVGARPSLSVAMDPTRLPGPVHCESSWTFDSIAHSRVIYSPASPKTSYTKSHRYHAGRS